ncbi:glycosyltransferase [bacterium]|nr:glycosyltransferase [bacterium]MBU1754074.1 glycosyltransferase [bacterium]
MNTVRIMHLLHSLETGGLEKGTATLVNNMNPEMFESSICCLSGFGPSLKLIKREEMKIFDMKTGESHEPFLFLRLAKLFKEQRINILHAKGWPTLFDGVLGARIAGVPVVIYSEHGKNIDDFYEIKKRRVWTRRLLSPFIDKIVTVSEELKKGLVEVTGLNKKQIVCIHNGVEFHDVCVKYEEKKREIGVEQSDILVGTVGRLDPVKNFDIFIRSVEGVLREFPTVKFLLIGDGPIREDLESIVSELDLRKHVIFLGERNDVVELLKIMDIFVLPSKSEGLSNTILEAMSAELPVIATDVGGNSELVVDGETGILIQPGDIFALSVAIINLLRDDEKRKKMGEAGFIRAREKFSIELMVKSYEELYLLWHKKKCGLCRENF